MPLDVKLANELVDTGQKSLVRLRLLAEFILEVLSLVDPLQDHVFVLRILDDFLQRRVD
jgi:hypothetical protein